MKNLGMADPGHGDFDSGAVGNGFRECDLVWKYATKFVAAMQRCGVTMLLTREQNKTAKGNQAAELAYRAQLANSKGVGFYLSFHDNSGGGTGFESFRCGNDPSTVKLQQLIHGKIAPLFTSNGMPDRGMKTADFYVIKHTKMPAVLLELGFIDNARDAKYISDDAFQTKVAEAATKAVCEWIGIAYVSATPPAPKKYELYYKGVLESTFDKKDEAYKFGWEQFKSYPDAYIIEPSGARFTFSAHPELNPNKQVTAPKPVATPVQSVPVLQPVALQGAPILGDAKATAEQLLGYARSVNSGFPVDISSIYIEIGKKYGIRGDIAFCQMLKETGYFKFGGDVKLEQNNFAGLGATGGVAGASFVTVRDGVSAHIQHLFAYATTQGIPEGEQLIDPRFALVSRGSATNWESLNGKWAVPGDGYGQEIIAIFQKALTFKNEPKVSRIEPQKDVVDRLVAAGVVHSPEYWKGLLAGSESLNTDYLKTLLTNAADKLEEK